MNLNNIDWNKFRTFYHVAKAGSFTKAAQLLHVSQPSLSRRIASLEASLNMRLFKRGVRGLILTEEGKTLLGTVDAMFNVFLGYGEKINHQQDEPQGLLKISLPHHLPTLKISECKAEFRKAYPDVRFAFVDGSRDVGFSAYEADAAIREFDENAQNLEQIYLATSQVRLYASAEYLKENGTPQKPEDLNHHDLIALGNPDQLPSCAFNWALETGMTSGTKRTPVSCEKSIAEMKEDVQKGLGIAALPEEYAAADPSLVRVFPNMASLPVDLYYVYSTHHKGTKRVTAYGDFLAEKLNSDKAV